MGSREWGVGVEDLKNVSPVSNSHSKQNPAVEIVSQVRITDDKESFFLDCCS